MKTLTLLDGSIVTVDDQDHRVVAHYYWRRTERGHVVATSWIGKSDHEYDRDNPTPVIFLRHLIAGRMGIDHKLLAYADRDPLNCQRSNLLTATVSQVKTTNDTAIRASSGFKGVYCAVPKRKRTNMSRWSARIYVSGKIKRLGTFDTQSQAAEAYDRAAIEQYGPFAFTNAMAAEARKKEQA